MKTIPAVCIYLLILLALVGCSPQGADANTDSRQETDSSDSGSEAAPLETAESLEPAQAPLPVIILTPAQIDITPEALMTPATLDQREQVAYATQDLATRLNISTEEITLVDATAVVWRDGSLGCPQPGMMYTQALVEGMRIRLSVGEVIYHYHSGRSGQPFLCENPSAQGELPASGVTE